ncbi:MAG: alpha-L-rhamnosidase C-terminal domain-containing protein [Draconibacterium sp.]
MANVDWVYQKIVSEWERNAENFQLKVVVPSRTTAKVTSFWAIDTNCLKAKNQWQKEKISILLKDVTPHSCWSNSRNLLFYCQIARNVE